jgi:hypothetical protein
LRLNNAPRRRNLVLFELITQGGIFIVVIANNLDVKKSQPKEANYNN